MKFFKFINNAWKKFNHSGYYPEKCSQTKHSFPLITPTLARRAIIVREKSCQCGKYKNCAESLKANLETINNVLKTS